MAAGSYVRKLQRAEAHIDDALRIVVDWELNDDNFAIEYVDDESTATFEARVTLLNAPPSALNDVVSDALQNLRQCLDHLAYELAEHHTNPLPEVIAKASEFPIYAVGDANERKAIDRKTAGLSTAAKAAILELQPFSHDGPDLLWVLHELGRVDKHRELLAVTSKGGPMALAPRPGAPQELKGPVKISAVGGVLRLGVSTVAVIASSREALQWVTPVPRIALLDDAPAAPGIPVQDVLRSVYHHVAEVVIPTLTPFLS